MKRSGCRDQRWVVLCGGGGGALWSTHWCPSEGYFFVVVVVFFFFHRRLAESMNKWWQHGLTVSAPSLLPSSEGKGSAVLPALVAVGPRVHHTSRKRELLVLAWKGSDHMRRRSPWRITDASLRVASKCFHRLKKVWKTFLPGWEVLDLWATAAPLRLESCNAMQFTI